jgi:diguanylate cyclase (GGDEF)-like protein
MFEASELLKSYIQGIRNLSGAEAVSLFVPAPLSGISQPVLIHEGEAAEIPELRDLETAIAFLQAQGDSTASPAFQAGFPTAITSQDEDCSLVALPSVEAFWADGLWPEKLFRTSVETPGRRATDLPAASGGEAPAAWLGLRFSPGEGSPLERLESRSLPDQVSRDEDPTRWWDWLFSLGGALAAHASHVFAVLLDPITGLPDRTGFQAILSEKLEKARVNRQHLSLLLVNPDDFATINERFGREAGDSIVQEMSERLRTVLRSSDTVARYGGVVFAAALAGTNGDASRNVAEKILSKLAEGSYLDGAVRLGFSIGIAEFDPSDASLSQPLELIRRADQALNAAKRLGGGCIADWEEGSGIAETGAFDRLSGIFTGNMAKDYRNMVLLWDSIDVIAVNQQFDSLAAEAVERLYTALKPNRVGLYSLDKEGVLQIVRGLTRQGLGPGRQERVETVEFAPELDELLRLSVAAGEPRELGPEDRADTSDTVAYAIPLIASGKSLGALYLDGDADHLELESSDLVFLKALASQLAVALDRAQLTELQAKRREHERRELRAELNELRQALHQAKLVYRSQEMETILATARRVARTDATVLITGESGTGKELLARTVHELSTRRSKPMVIVDCGSIPTTLMESELFGHEKGAYTGAHGRRVGRLAEADGGTVLLDEIGEIPLDVQSKLLRFVQEKQFTTVGGTKPQQVDVRIIAATNRDLAVEVAEGRFREDLYYRLNVIRIEVPPLRQRPDDILHLARYFLEGFSIQYQKSVRRFSEQAEAEMVAHSWPGNIRELQNRVMRAVILCEGEELAPSDLQLADDQYRISAAVPSTSSRPTVEPSSVSTPNASSAPAPPSAVTGIDVWDRLREAFSQELELFLSDRSAMLFPLGRWVREDLILEANDVGGGVARRGAGIIGIPETTFRRRLAKAREEARAGLSPRSGRWPEIRSLLREIVRSKTPQEGSDLVKEANRILLEVVVDRIPNDTQTGSRILGITPPTFRARVGELNSTISAAADG